MQIPYWSKTKLQEFAEEFCRHEVLMSHNNSWSKRNARLRRKAYNKLAEALGEENSAAIMNRIGSFKAAAIREMRFYVRKYPCREGFGAPAWIWKLDPIYHVVDNAVQDVISNKISRQAVLANMAIEMVSRASAAYTCSDGDPPTSLTSPRIMHTFVRDMNVSSEAAGSIWQRFYWMAVTKAEVMWRRGDRVAGAALTAGREEPRDWLLAEWAAVGLAARRAGNRALEPKNLENLEQFQSLQLLFQLVMTEMNKTNIFRRRTYCMFTVSPMPASEGVREEEWLGPAPEADEKPDPTSSGYYLSREVWQNVIRNYIMSGRTVLPIVLQRRWFELCELARDTVLDKWAALRPSNTAHHTHHADDTGAGDTAGNVAGDTPGNIAGGIAWNIAGDTAGNISGDTTGNIAGYTVGNIAGGIAGNIAGDTAGNVAGYTAGNIAGDTTGNMAEVSTKKIPRIVFRPEYETERIFQLCLKKAERMERCCEIGKTPKMDLGTLPLLMAIVAAFPKLVTTPMPSWQEMVDRGWTHWFDEELNLKIEHKKKGKVDNFYYNQLKKYDKDMAHYYQLNENEQLEKEGDQQRDLTEKNDSTKEFEDLVKTLEKIDPSAAKVCVVFDSDSDENAPETNEIVTNAPNVESYIDSKNIKHIYSESTVMSQNVARKKVAKSNFNASFTMSELIDSQLEHNLRRKVNLLFEDDIDGLKDGKKTSNNDDGSLSKWSDRRFVEHSDENDDSGLLKVREFRKLNDDDDDDDERPIDEKLLQVAEVCVVPLEHIGAWRRLGRRGTLNCRRISVRRFMEMPKYTDCRKRKYKPPEEHKRKQKKNSSLNIYKNVKRKRLSKLLKLKHLNEVFWSEKNISLLEMCKPCVVKVVKLLRVVKKVELPDIEEVRRINRNILTAQVVPISVLGTSSSTRTVGNSMQASPNILTQFPTNLEHALPQMPVNQAQMSTNLVLTQPSQHQMSSSTEFLSMFGSRSLNLPSVSTSIPPVLDQVIPNQSTSIPNRNTSQFGEKTSTIVRISEKGIPLLYQSTQILEPSNSTPDSTQFASNLNQIFQSVESNQHLNQTTQALSIFESPTGAPAPPVSNHVPTTHEAKLVLNPTPVIPDQIGNSSITSPTPEPPNLIKANPFSNHVTSIAEVLKSIEATIENQMTTSPSTSPKTEPPSSTKANPISNHASSIAEVLKSIEATVENQITTLPLTLPRTVTPNLTKANLNVNEPTSISGELKSIETTIENQITSLPLALTTTEINLNQASSISGGFKSINATIPTLMKSAAAQVLKNSAQVRTNLEQTPLTLPQISHLNQATDLSFSTPMTPNSFPVSQISATNPQISVQNLPQDGSIVTQDTSVLVQTIPSTTLSTQQTPISASVPPASTCAVESPSASLTEGPNAAQTPTVLPPCPIPAQDSLVMEELKFEDWNPPKSFEQAAVSANVSVPLPSQVELNSLLRKLLAKVKFKEFTLCKNHENYYSVANINEYKERLLKDMLELLSTMPQFKYYGAVFEMCKENDTSGRQIRKQIKKPGAKKVRLVKPKTPEPPPLPNAFDEWERQKSVTLQYFSLPGTKRKNDNIIENNYGERNKIRKTGQHQSSNLDKETNANQESTSKRRKMLPDTEMSKKMETCEDDNDVQFIPSEDPPLFIISSDEDEPTKSKEATTIETDVDKDKMLRSLLLNNYNKTALSNFCVMVSTMPPNILNPPTNSVDTTASRFNKSVISVDDVIKRISEGTSESTPVITEVVSLAARAGDVEKETEETSKCNKDSQIENTSEIMENSKSTETNILKVKINNKIHLITESVGGKSENENTELSTENNKIEDRPIDSDGNEITNNITDGNIVNDNEVENDNVNKLIDTVVNNKIERLNKAIDEKNNMKLLVKKDNKGINVDMDSDSVIVLDDGCDETVSVSDKGYSVVARTVGSNVDLGNVTGGQGPDPIVISETEIQKIATLAQANRGRVIVVMPLQDEKLKQAKTSACNSIQVATRSKETCSCFDSNKLITSSVSELSSIRMSLNDYVKEEFTTNNPLIRVDSALSLWKIFDEYIILTPSNIYVKAPILYTAYMGALVEIVYPPDYEESPMTKIMNEMIPEFIICACAYTVGKCNLCQVYYQAQEKFNKNVASDEKTQNTSTKNIENLDLLDSTIVENETRKITSKDDTQSGLDIVEIDKEMPKTALLQDEDNNPKNAENETTETSTRAKDIIYCELENHNAEYDNQNYKTAVSNPIRQKNKLKTENENNDTEILNNTDKEVNTVEQERQNPESIINVEESNNSVIDKIQTDVKSATSCSKIETPNLFHDISELNKSNEASDTYIRTNDVNKDISRINMNCNVSDKEAESNKLTKDNPITDVDSVACDTEIGNLVINIPQIEDDLTSSDSETESNNLVIDIPESVTGNETPDTETQTDKLAENTQETNSESIIRSDAKMETNNLLDNSSDVEMHPTKTRESIINIEKTIYSENKSALEDKINTNSTVMETNYLEEQYGDSKNDNNTTETISSTQKNISNTDQSIKIEMNNLPEHAASTNDKLDKLSVGKDKETNSDNSKDISDAKSNKKGYVKLAKKSYRRTISPSLYGMKCIDLNTIVCNEKVFNRILGQKRLTFVRVDGRNKGMAHVINDKKIVNDSLYMKLPGQSRIFRDVLTVVSDPDVCRSLLSRGAPLVALSPARPTCPLPLQPRHRADSTAVDIYNYIRSRPPGERCDNVQCHPH